MKNRLFLTVCFFAAWIPLAKLQAQPPLNILLIMADDLGYEKLGCYGGIDVATPTLDKMAKEGVLYERAYASPVCTPSRMSLYTGTYVPRHQYVSVLPIHTGSKKTVDFKKWTSLATVFQDAGYQTTVTGKWQLAGLESHPDHPRSAGFESWCLWQIWKDGAKTTRYWNATYNQNGQVLTDIDETFGPDILTDFLISRMKTAKAEKKPFFIHHNMVLPHYPVVDTPATKAHAEKTSHDAMITYMDGEIEELLQALRDLDLLSETLIVFIGDNGTQSQLPRQTKAGSVTGGKWDLNDAGTHVPLIFYAPGKLNENQRIQGLVEITDLYPTLIEAAGLELDSSLKIDGISFYESLNGETAAPRSFVTAGIGGDFFVFDGNWRLHHQGNTLIDCRNLPREIQVKPDSQDPEALAAREALQPQLDNLRELWKVKAPR
ncbi:sulfatase-like hydrolase/transferase [Kiritimatiellaeota bacterium B1221]|nr:sulfatase-like hydrolase/transferase [Kiritimatiellaeota bacterium B1221]